MKTSVSLSNTKNLILADALMIYRQESTTYITHHMVENGQLGPARTLTTSFIDALARSTRDQMDVEVLPANMLVRTADTMVWWTPAQRRVMFFAPAHTESESIKTELNGKVFPHPALVWMASGDGTLSVRALMESDRPEASTPLYVAPYWNTYDDASICLGDSPRPTTRSVAAIDQWMDGFFRSRFSHTVRSQIVVSKQGYLKFALGIAAAETFPPHALLNAKETLGDFIRKGTRD